MTTALYGGEWLRLLSAVLTTPLVFFNLNVGNFDLDGRPAPDWALGTSGTPDNFFDFAIRASSTIFPRADGVWCRKRTASA